MPDSNCYLLERKSISCSRLPRRQKSNVTFHATTSLCSFEGIHRTTLFEPKKNLYGQKQAGRVWNQHLVKGLSRSSGSNRVPSTNACSTEIHHGATLFDDGILWDQVLMTLRQYQELAKLYNITDAERRYLESRSPSKCKCRSSSTSPDSANPDDMGMKANTKTKDKAARSSTIPSRLGWRAFSEKWTTVPSSGSSTSGEIYSSEIAYAVHQCAICQQS
jgi:hypothetical protein